MSTTPIPKIRPVGSPLAKVYGATNSQGEPKSNVVPVEKSQRVPSRRDGMSPNEVVNGRPADDEGHRRSLAALTALHGPSIAQLERLQRVRKAKAKTAQVAVFDANGNLIGTVDQADIVELASTTAPAKTAAPFTPSTTAPTAAPAPGEPGSNPPRTGTMPVAKSRLQRTGRVIQSIASQNAAFHRRQDAKQALKRGRR